MGGPKSKVPREEILSAFTTEEPFKAFALRVGMSPNTLRGIWKESFGGEAFKERGKRLQAKAASETCKATAHSRVYKDISVACSECGEQVILKSNQVAQMAVDSFVCERCQYDRTCPVCGLPVDGGRGLSGHFRHRGEAGDTAHIEYREAQGEKRWEALRPDEDYVVCLICGHKAETLARHLKTAHGITSGVYRSQQGQDAQIRSLKVEHAMSESAKDRKGGSGKGGTKDIACPSCGVVWVGSKFLASMTHDFRCSECRKRAEDARWVGLSEPDDYVTCRECGYRAESLVSHFQNEHPDYRQRHPDAPVVSLNSAVRDKTALQGVQRSSEFKERIRQAKLLNLTLEDFSPFLEPDGSVDHGRMMLGIQCAWPTLKNYIEELGLKATDKYVKKRIEAHTVRLSPQDLEPFKLKNGKISLSSAAGGLGFVPRTLKRECRRLGLRWAHGNISQRRCLDALSVALGGIPYRSEWKSWRFVNPKSGHRFRFDGFFEPLGLVVEFQGNFHYTFPSYFLPNESYRPVYEAICERDQIKREMILASPDLHYLEITEEEPYNNSDYLKGRLFQMGILPCGEVGVKPLPPSLL